MKNLLLLTELNNQIKKEVKGELYIIANYLINQKNKYDF